jgi:hypothetical protein
MYPKSVWVRIHRCLPVRAREVSLKSYSRFTSTKSTWAWKEGKTVKGHALLLQRVEPYKTPGYRVRIAGHTHKVVLQFNTKTQGTALLHALADIPLWNTNYIWYFPEAMSVSVQRVLRRRATSYSGDAWIQRNSGQPRNVQHDYSALLRCRSTWGDEHFPLVDSKETILKGPGTSSNSFAKVVRTSPRATAQVIPKPATDVSRATAQTQKPVMGVQDHKQQQVPQRVGLTTTTVEATPAPRQTQQRVTKRPSAARREVNRIKERQPGLPLPSALVQLAAPAFRQEAAASSSSSSSSSQSATAVVPAVTSVSANCIQVETSAGSSESSASSSRSVSSLVSTTVGTRSGSANAVNTTLAQTASVEAIDLTEESNPVVLPTPVQRQEPRRQTPVRRSDRGAIGVETKATRRGLTIPMMAPLPSVAGRATPLVQVDRRTQIANVVSTLATGAECSPPTHIPLAASFQPQTPHVWANIDTACALCQFRSATRCIVCGLGYCMQHAADRNSECEANMSIPELQQLRQQLVAAAPQQKQDMKSYFAVAADRAANAMSDFLSLIPGLESPDSSIPEEQRQEVGANRVRARLRRATRRGRDRAMLRIHLATLEIQLSQNEQLRSWINEDEKKILDHDQRTHKQRVRDRRANTDYWHRTFELRRNRLRVDETQITTVMATIRDMLAQIEAEESMDSI